MMISPLCHLYGLYIRLILTVFSPIPRHAGNQLRHTTPAGDAGYDQTGTDQRSQREKQFVHAKSQKNLQYQQHADCNLDLAFQRYGRTTTLQRKTSLFPGLCSSFNQRQIGVPHMPEALGRTLGTRTGLASYVQGFVTSHTGTIEFARYCIRNQLLNWNMLGTR